MPQYGGKFYKAVFHNIVVMGIIPRVGRAIVGEKRIGIPSGTDRIFYDDDWHPFTKWEALGNIIAGAAISTILVFEFIGILISLPFIGIFFLIGGTWYCIGKLFKLV